MTLSIWRYAHLVLALISAGFLIVLSLTGIVLAYDAIQEKTPPYQVENFQDITLAQSIPALRQVYAEILEITVDHNQFVTIDAADEEGNTIQAYIHPITGEQLGEIQPKSAFIQWNLSLHRSLFMHETGRALVAIVSFLLLLITISGLVLILKRQNGWRNFFAKVNKEYFSQYIHVVTGKWMLIPILIIAFTGTFIFIARLETLQKENIEILHIANESEETNIDISQTPFFKNTKLATVKKIEFPFIPDDADEPFIITMEDKIVQVNQVTGELISESRFPYLKVLENINLDLHTGRTNIIWAIILGLAAINILCFIYTGFVITYKRTRNKIKNKYKASEADIVILIGSENGTTVFFANQIHNQLLSAGKRAYMAQMNEYSLYPNAEQILVFTSTYGLGQAPSNANNFEELLAKIPQTKTIQYSVIGFGSKTYEDFCAYAVQVDNLLQTQPWAHKILDVYKINDRSAEEFVQWVSAWSQQTGINLATTPAIYKGIVPNLKKFKVIEKTLISATNSTFKIVLQPQQNQKFASGDLMAIYPANDNRERFYSIGKIQNNVQLMVKLYPHGLGSSYLYNLEKGDMVLAKIMENSNFHFPATAKNVIMIANGTGIAPFLGMIANNHQKTPIQVYTGFRYQNELTQNYQDFAQKWQEKGHLQAMHFAFSRENNKQYVMDLIRRDAMQIAQMLQQGSFIMICGALVMQKDVEKVLDEIVLKYNAQSLAFYKNNGQILTDCY